MPRQLREWEPGDPEHRKRGTYRVTMAVARRYLGELVVQASRGSSFVFVKGSKQRPMARLIPASKRQPSSSRV